MCVASPDTLFKLHGKTALVTGGSRGIGRSLAQGLAAAGADIIVTTRTADPLTELCQLIEDMGRQCHVFQLDVRDVSSVNGLFCELENQCLSADILINNAGVEQVRPSVDVDEALWDDICDTNLKGAFFVAQRFAKALMGSQKAGSLINLGSLTSAVGVPAAAAYTASKSGILGMTRALSSEWSPQGIRVNAIGPGYFRTELTEEFYQDSQWQETMLTKIPMNRFGHLDDLKGIAVFLACDASSYISGQIFYVDGGYLASI